MSETESEPSYHSSLLCFKKTKSYRARGTTRSYQRSQPLGFCLTLKIDFAIARSIRKVSKSICYCPFPLFTLEGLLMFPCSLQVFHRHDRRACHYPLLACRTAHNKISHQTWSISKLAKSYGNSITWQSKGVSPLKTSCCAAQWSI
jgi:hypothetical protein